MTIIIMNPMEDIHGQHMAAYLDSLGIPYLELGSPYSNDYTLWDNTLVYNGNVIPAPQGVYFRSVMSQAPELFAQNDSEAKYIAQVQFNAFVETVRTWLALLARSGVRTVNAPVSSSKYLQIQLLQTAGIPMPRTCITSSSEAARLFVEQVGKAVCKPLPGGSYCRKVTPELLDAMDQNLNEPVIFQEEIEGEDIRVNMLEGNILSAHKILKPDGILDYRTASDYSNGEAQYEEVSIPEAVRAFCDQAMRILGLRFSGIDLRMNGDTFTLIECNSMPAYLDIELKTGSPITAEIVNYFLNGPEAKQMGAKTFSLPRLKKNGIRSIQPGVSFFDYYKVMKDWSELMLKHKQRVILPLNQEQKAMFAETNGIQAQYMEVEVIEGKANLLRVW